MRLLPLLLAAAVVTPTLSAQSTTRGIQLFQSSDWTAAKAELSAVVKRNDDDHRAHYYLGRIAILENDADAAADHLERAVKLDDNVAEYHLWYGTALSRQVATANMMKQALIARSVKAEFERAVALDAKSLDARDALFDFYSMAPEMMGGGPVKAREQADALAKLDAMRGHYALGRLAVRTKDTASVERELNAAIAAAPDTFRLYSTLTAWYVTQKQWPHAFATLDRYIKRRPNDPYGPNAVGRVAAASGLELERGEKGIRAFVAKPPKEATSTQVSLAYLRLGQVLEHQGKKAEARTAFDQAVKLDPKNDEAQKALK